MSWRQRVRVIAPSHILGELLLELFELFLGVDRFLLEFRMLA